MTAKRRRSDNDPPGGSPSNISKRDSPWVDGSQVFTSTSDSSHVLHLVGLNLANFLTPEGEADGSLPRQPQEGGKKG